MKIKFTPFGFIACFEMIEDGQGGRFSRRLFDTKRAALNWVKEDPEMRGICAECIV